MPGDGGGTVSAEEVGDWGSKRPGADEYRGVTDGADGDEDSGNEAGWYSSGSIVSASEEPTDSSSADLDLEGREDAERGAEGSCGGAVGLSVEDESASSESEPEAEEASELASRGRRLSRLR